MEISPNSKILKNEGVLFTNSVEETIFMHIENGKYYRTNETGSAIWECIDKGTTIDDVIHHCAKKFEVDYNECEKDVLEFVKDLVQNGFVTLE